MSRRDGTIEFLKQLLDAEEQSQELTRLPADTYTRVADYVLKLRKSGDVTADDLLSKLIRKQLSIIEGMGSQLLDRRLSKAASRQDMKDLLPEEKFVCEFHMEFLRLRTRFAKAIANGQQSTFTTLRKSQMQKKVTVRFQKPLEQIVGFDLNKYGPFQVHDVAEVPAANAEALVSNGVAKIVHSSDSI